MLYLKACLWTLESGKDGTEPIKAKQHLESSPPATNISLCSRVSPRLLPYRQVVLLFLKAMNWTILDTIIYACNSSLGAV